MAIMDLIWALIGHFEGTNIGYMGIYCHICIRIVPPSFAGGFMGAKPPECPLSTGRRRYGDISSRRNWLISNITLQQ